MNISFIKNGHQIKEIEEFKPKLDDQWADGRSSKELATLAFGNTDAFKDRISNVLKDCGLPIQDFICVPEASAGLGEGMGKGGPRWHDLLMVGQDVDDDERVTICIEAKVSETFGDLTIGEEKESQKHKYNEDVTRTRAYKLERFLTPNSNVDDIGYQLFTATRGTMMSAINNNCTNCIMLVIVFKGVLNSSSGETEEQYNSNRIKNDDDIKKFKQASHATNDRIEREIGGETVRCWIKEIKI